MVPSLSACLSVCRSVHLLFCLFCLYVCTSLLRLSVPLFSLHSLPHDLGNHTTQCLAINICTSSKTRENSNRSAAWICLLQCTVAAVEIWHNRFGPHFLAWCNTVQSVQPILNACAAFQSWRRHRIGTVCAHPSDYSVGHLLQLRNHSYTIEHLTNSELYWWYFWAKLRV